MEMNDKLHKKKPRVKWYLIIQAHSYLERDFSKWKKERKYKIRSLNKLAYIYLRETFGIWFIKRIREDFASGKLDLSTDFITRIVKSSWIVDLVDED